ncbi:hypothetical protein HAX54_028663, partial [Datura stramonium]|nr:hypothetical protein [Datura stramonium]
HPRYADEPPVLDRIQVNWNGNRKLIIKSRIMICEAPMECRFKEVAEAISSEPAFHPTFFQT